jgi:hypothetical protein
MTECVSQTGLERDVDELVRALRALLNESKPPVGAAPAPERETDGGQRDGQE